MTREIVGLRSSVMLAQVAPRSCATLPVSGRWGHAPAVGGEFPEEFIELNYVIWPSGASQGQCRGDPGKHSVP